MEGARLSLEVIEQLVSASNDSEKLDLLKALHKALNVAPALEVFGNASAVQQEQILNRLVDNLASSCE